MLLNKILRFFGINYPEPVDLDRVRERKRRLIRKVVARNARGNVSLQQGKYILPNTVDQVQRTNQAYDFEKGC